MKRLNPKSHDSLFKWLITSFTREFFAHYFGEVYGHSVNLTAMTLNSGQYLILIGNGNPKRFIPEYQKRWDMEERLACLKSREFNFEDTHLTNPHKISTIMAILT